MCLFEVHFRGNERILFDYKLSQMFLGDMCKLKILRQGEVMTVEVKLDLVTSLVPTQLYDKRPRYVLTDCNTRHTQVSAWPSVVQTFTIQITFQRKIIRNPYCSMVYGQVALKSSRPRSYVA